MTAAEARGSIARGWRGVASIDGFLGLDFSNIIANGLKKYAVTHQSHCLPSIKNMIDNK